jgi:hypothetical protein
MRSAKPVFFLKIYKKITLKNLTEYLWERKVVYIHETYFNAAELTTTLKINVH